MRNRAARTSPPDQAAREQALDGTRSVIVQAPAGSGKTDLLTRRFLRLLGQVDDPAEIVAITFTRDAAAEMRHRILAELEKSAARDAKDAGAAEADEFSMEALADRARQRSDQLGWNLLELPAQLRISTIDAFCRELALKQPLLSGLGGGLDIFEEPEELYRRAARRTLLQIDTAPPELRTALERLLLWRDNGWQEMENLLVGMLAGRDRWMHGFVLSRAQDWDLLRQRLERPFARAVREKLLELNRLLDRVPHAREEALELARFACAQTEGALHGELAERGDLPEPPFEDAEALEEAREACACLGKLLQTQKGEWRSEKGLNVKAGFPATDAGRAAKARFGSLVADLDRVPGLEAALAAVAQLPPPRYADEDWEIVRACFSLLRHAVGELKVVFAEAGATDYIEVAQIAQAVLRGDETGPGDAAIAIADGIRHLLVDEFQDTSRRQHEMLRSLIAAWPEREERTCFVVGDPMQSIYFFRDADAELFPRVKTNGLEIAGDEPLGFDAVGLEANFRTAHGLVTELNQVFAQVFAEADGSGVTFAHARPARNGAATGPQLVAEEQPRMTLHLEFMPRAAKGKGVEAAEKERIAAEREAARSRQSKEIVALIRSHSERMRRAAAEGGKYRIAVLGRTRAALAPIAEALHAEQIPFRAVDLECLKDRQEVRDALALARALLNPHDRIAWLGVLRAPWCGLSLADLYALVSGDDGEVQKRPVAELMKERDSLLSGQGRAAVGRVRRAMEAAPTLRRAQPASALGTWIEQVWLELGGADSVTPAERANLDLVWRSLDHLRGGEQDVLGPALDAALEKLMALPDPDANSDCGVQLMTIHKSKGLEFEVVIVPELQAGTRRTHFALLSWLERGLEQPDESGEITEFLVAPLAAKGAERSGTRVWVDAERACREAQELRRLLYVAATRAREELHLFARPEYSAEADGSRSLAAPQNCLLHTGWPAFEEEVRRQFDAWTAAAAEPGTLETVAAAETTMVPADAKPARLLRLPDDYEVRRLFLANAASAPGTVSGAADPLYRRHEGGLLSRALGTAVHTLLEELARLRLAHPWEAARAALAASEPRISAQVRAAGIDVAQAGRIAGEALRIALDAGSDPVAQWILSPHPQAASEARWAGVVNGELRSVQVDRVFRAGLEPFSEGDAAWWIIDYKTAHAEEPQTSIERLRAVFAPQLAAYARVLRGLHGADATMRAGLYYPRMRRFDWWEI